MLPIDESPAEEDGFAEELARLDDAIASGDTPSIEDAGAPLGDRGLRALESLRLLERERRRGGPDSFSTLDFSTALAIDPATGTGRLGRFQLLGELGRGGNGIVFRAFDPLLKREVALKIPRPETLLTTDARRRMVREAQAAAGLDHPNIIPLYEAGQVGPLNYLASAYCPGPTLAEWFRHSTSPIPWKQAAQIVLALADGVAYMHVRGIWHRDVKPANVLLAPPLSESPGELPFTPRLTDFGLARFADGSAFTKATATGAILGTPGYMAPEQARGDGVAIGPTTDVFALGCVLHELLVGRPPFQAENDYATLGRLAEEEAAGLRRLRRDIPRDLETVCLKCLEKEPFLRYPNGAELAEDLRRVLEGKRVMSRQRSAAERVVRSIRRRPRAAAAASLAAVAFLVVAGWGATQSLRLDRASTENVQRHREEVECREIARRQEALARAEDYQGRMRQAGSLWREGRTGPLRELLRPLRHGLGEEDLRGFEWHYLWRHGRNDRSFRIDRPTDGGIAFSPNGKSLFLAHIGGVETRDVEDGRRLHNWTGPALARGVALLTPDGKYMLSASKLAAGPQPFEMRLWETASETLLRSHVQSRPGLNTNHAFSPDGRAFVYDCRLSTDKLHEGIEVRIWNPQTGEDRLLVGASNKWYTAFRFSSDSRLLAGVSNPQFGSNANSLTIWDVASARALASFDLRHVGMVRGLAFSPDGKHVATAGNDGRICVWDARTGHEIGKVEGLLRTFNILEFAPDGNTLAVGGLAIGDRDGDVMVFKLDSKLEWKTGLTAVGLPDAMAFSPDGKTLAISFATGDVRLWEPDPEPVSVALPGPAGAEAWSVAFSPDGRTLAVGYDDDSGMDRRTLQLWNVAGRKVRAVLEGHGAMVFASEFSPDGRQLLSSSWDKTVRVWDPESGKQIRSLEGHTGQVRLARISPDGQTIVSCSDDNTIRFWDVATGREFADRRLTASRRSQIALCRNGARLAVSHAERIQVRELDTGVQLLELIDRKHVSCLAISPSGALLASANADGEVKLWDMATGELKATCVAHKPGGKVTLAFTPDGKTLASGGEEKSVRLWNSVTGAEYLAFTDLSAHANGLAFSPDGRILAAALHDGTVRLWEAGSQKGQ